MIVVVILMIFSSLTIISYHNMSRGLVARSQASEINAAFVLARELAITNSTLYQVVIDRENEAFWIDRLDSVGNLVLPQVSGIEAYLTQAVVSSITVNSTVVPPSGASSQAVILFRPDGTSDRAVIQMHPLGADINDDTEYFTIILYPPTANSRIYPNERRS